MKKWILISVILWISCCRNQESEQCVNPVNPNGDSELALLMRSMAEHAEKEKISIEKGDPQGKYNPEFEKITTAVPTESKELSSAYDGYAALYIEALKGYHASGENMKISAFNNMIQTCINCHRDECPGPLRRIEKMKIASAPLSSIKE